MADSDFDLSGRVKIDTSELEGLSQRVGSSFKGMAAMAAGALAAVGVGSLLKDAVDEARDAEKIGRLTENVIRSTGGAAHVTAGQVGDLAETLSNYAGVDDDVIQGGANLMLTFKGVRNEVGKGNDIFNQANKAAVDLAATFGTDVNGAAMLVGKALDNPAAGLSKLTKMGVTFTDQQKEQVKALTASGRVMDAQKIILGELASQTGGAAAAAADPWQRFEVVVGNLKERLGGALLPTINNVATILADRLPPIINNVMGLFSRFADVVGPYISRAVSAVQAIFRGDLAGAGVDIGRLFGLEEDSDATGRIIAGLGTIKDGVLGVIDFVTTNGPKMVAFFEDQVLPVIKRVGDFVSDNLVPILAGIGTVLAGAGIASIIGTIAGLAPVLAALVSPVGLVVVGIAALVAGLVYAYQHFEGFRNVVDTVVRFVVEQFGNLVAFAREIFPQLQEAVEHVFNAIQVVIGFVIENIMAAWRLFGDDIIKVGRGAFEIVRSVVETAINTIAGVIRLVLAVINGDWGKAWNALKDIVGGIFDGIKGVISGALTAITGLFGGLYDGLKRAASVAFRGVTDAVGDVVGGMANVGRDIVEGIISGITRMARRLREAVMAFARDNIPKPIAEVLGIASPSRVAMALGAEVPAGFALGIERGTARVQSAVGDMLALPAAGSPGAFAAGVGAGGVTIGDIYISGVANADDVRGVIPELTDALRAAVGVR